MFPAVVPYSVSNLESILHRNIKISLGDPAYRQNTNYKYLRKRILNATQKNHVDLDVPQIDFHYCHLTIRLILISQQFS